MASPVEILIVMFAFGIVGTYLMCWRRFLNRCETPDETPPSPAPETHPSRLRAARV